MMADFKTTGVQCSHVGQYNKLSWNVSVDRSIKYAKFNSKTNSVFQAHISDQFIPKRYTKPKTIYSYISYVGLNLLYIHIGSYTIIP